VQSCAHSETLLLQAYNVSPPPRCTGSEPQGIRDSVANWPLASCSCTIRAFYCRAYRCLSPETETVFSGRCRVVCTAARTTTFICTYARLWRLPRTGNGMTLRPLRTRGYSRIKCLFGVGEFQLCQEFRQFSMSVTTWSQSTYKKRQRHFSRFLRTIKPIKAKVVASSDGMRHVLAPVSGGKKPGQTKRKRTAKTTTVKKGKTE